MKPERILLPLDIRNCPMDVFSFVEGFARRPENTLILLHVVDLNIAALDNRIYDELAFEAHGYLERLAREYIRPQASTLLHVRVGRRAEEILEEAKVEDAELIILPTHGPSPWRRLVSFGAPGVRWMVSPLTARIIRESTCGAFVVNVKSHFNCEREWGRARTRYDRALVGGRKTEIFLGPDYRALLAGKV